MRRARVSDYWRAITAYGGWTLRLNGVEYENVTGIGTGRVHFRSPLNLICGPNGVGKTTLLRAIWATLAPAEAIRLASTQFRLKDGRVKITVQELEDEKIIQINLADLAGIGTGLRATDIEVYHIDTSSLATSMQDYFCRFPNIQDALNGVPVLECSAENLETLSFLTHIPFIGAKIYTVEEAGEDRPFFEVQTGDAGYDTRSMGLGELAACYLWWSLERANNRTVVLIEEPESFLSPMSQASFVDVLAKYTARKKCFVIVTTHSAEIIEQAEPSSLQFVYKERGNSRIYEGAPLAVLLNTVGIKTRVEVLIMVEDIAALAFGRLWLSHFDQRVASSVEFIAMNGEGNVVRTLQCFAGKSQTILLLGLLDGDMEGKFEGEIERSLAFLPGGKSVESMFREMAETEQNRIEPILGIANLAQILFTIRASEPHEWFEHFRRSANLTAEQLHLVLFKAWIAKPENSRAAQQHFELLKTKMIR